MKANLLPQALSALLLFPCLALAQGGAYTVQGQLGAKSGITRAYLSYGDGKAYRLDSTVVNKGHFLFTGTALAPERATLWAAKKPLHFPLHQRPSEITLYVEPGKVRVSSPDSLDHATLSGTPLNADQQRLATQTRATEQQLATMMHEWTSATDAQRKDKAFEAKFDERYETIQKAQKEILARFVQANPQTLVSLYAVKDLGGFAIDPAVVGPLYEGLAPAVRATKPGQQYAAKIEKARQLAVGALAPDFTQADASGKPVKLSDFRGKYVLVDFWASWCGPCRRENPNVVANYNKFKDKNFTVLGVSLDQPSGREAWLKAIGTDGLVWTQVSDLKGWQNEAARLYDINAIPQNLLIGPDGRIVAKNVRGDELGQKLAAVLPTTAQ